jgi:glucokinase
MAAARDKAQVLAGDIGGTKSLLGLYRVEDRMLAQLRQQHYATRDFATLEEVARDFLGGSRVDVACFGVPGPIIGGVSHATNVTWTMEEKTLAGALGALTVRLINDLEATAYGMLQLQEKEFAVLQAGEAPPAPAPIVVIAAGTGLGEAGLVPIGDGLWRSIASEGGHADFAPRGREQIELLEYLSAEFDHVSCERVLSGPGLVNIYKFLRARSSKPQPQWLADEMSRATDVAAVISETGLAGRDAQCAEALRIFVEIYGAEASNLALKYMALGGVFVGGGIAPKILSALSSGAFVRSFRAKGRLDKVLSRIPLRVSLNPGAALVGAARCAMEML